MRKRYKVFLYVIVIVVLLLISVTVYMQFFRNSKNEVDNKSSIVDNIDKFNYTLDDRDTNLMKDEFMFLKSNLDAKEIDYEAYAKSLSKLFIIDLFTINNKINKYDVGGLEYILDSEKEKFKNIILDSIYSNVLDNSYHKREQELPEVKSVVIESTKLEPYKMKNEFLDAYKIILSWDYIKELGYDNKAEIILINENDKLYIVQYNPLIDEIEGDVE